jgi:hypothetical protein
LLNLHEIQPDYVYVSIGGGTGVLPVDSAAPQTNTRTFTGYEGALSIDFAKGLPGLPPTCDVAFDYKHQETDLGLGTSPFSVDTFIACADAGPFPQIPLLEGLILSGAIEQAQSSGSEYTLNGVGNPPTLASYSSILDNSELNNYQYQALNITRTSYAFGVRCPISPTFEIHGDWFYNQYTWSDVPGFDRREQIWRLTYEVSF